MFATNARLNLAIEQINRAGKEGRPFFFALDYELTELILWLDPACTSPPVEGLCFRVGEICGGLESRSLVVPRILSFSPEGEEVYAHRFEVVYRALERGDSFLANLTLRTPIELSGGLEDVFTHTRARYQVLYPNHFVCFSPESFVHITPSGELTAYPMKGTIDAALPDAQMRILSDYKEDAEHYTIVDLMRNDLNRVGRRTHVRRFKYLDRLSTTRGPILQMSSEVVTQLSEDWSSRLGDILLSLLPAGSISGAPKAKTCEVIGQAEACPRGFYTGICGYFDGAGLDTGVMIRYIEQQGREFFYRSGGGITINSQMKEEYRECLQKIYLPLNSDL